MRFTLPLFPAATRRGEGALPAAVAAAASAALESLPVLAPGVVVAAAGLRGGRGGLAPPAARRRPLLLRLLLPPPPVLPVPLLRAAAAAAVLPTGSPAPLRLAPLPLTPAAAARGRSRAPRAAARAAAGRAAAHQPLGLGAHVVVLLHQRAQPPATAPLLSLLGPAAAASPAAPPPFVPGARAPLAPRPLPLPPVPAAGGGAGGRQEEQRLRRQRRLQERGLQEGRLQEREEQRVRGRRGGRLRLGREALPSPVMQSLLVGSCLRRRAAAAAPPAPASPAPAGRRLRGARHRDHSRPRTRTRPRDSAAATAAFRAPWRRGTAPAPGRPLGLASSLLPPAPARPPHMGARDRVGGRPAERRGPPATRKCLLGGLLRLTPSRAAAASPGAGPRCAELGLPRAAAAASASSSSSSSRTRSPAGRRGQAEPGRLSAVCPEWHAALRWPRARLPCAAVPRCLVPCGRRPGALPAADTRIHTHRGHGPAERSACARPATRGSRAPPIARQSVLLARMPGAGRTAPLSRDLPSPFLLRAALASPCPSHRRALAGLFS